MKIPGKIWVRVTTEWGGIIGGAFRNARADDATPFVRADLAEKMYNALQIQADLLFTETEKDEARLEAMADYRRGVGE